MELKHDVEKLITTKVCPCRWFLWGKQRTTSYRHWQLRIESSYLWRKELAL